MTHTIDPDLLKPEAATLTYDRYLKIEELIALQNPISTPKQHDEHLFIIIHQVYELWFKQLLMETEDAHTALKKSELMRFLRATGRIKRIQEVLVSQVSILETMTPNDFNLFRENINPASGFQSFQFRELEFRLGSKNKAYLNFFREEAFALKRLENALTTPSLYDVWLEYLARSGKPVPLEILNRNVGEPYVSNDSVTEIYADIYRRPAEQYDLYLCLEAFMDMDENLLLWRYRHLAMVERMIGHRRGTGGSSGAAYLQSTLVKRFFPEIWDVRNLLGKKTGNGY